ncbi:signal peptidase II [Candidatus Bipolaricaulota bacterium]|nr:signal peptidase II [Candidatus Bipolaricaulota bacterium]
MLRMLRFVPPLALVALDQVLKHHILSRYPPGIARPLLGDWVRLSVAQNPGGAFGLFPGHSELFLAVSSLVVLALVILLVAVRRIPTFYRFGLPLLLAGAAGNLIDRAFLGYVVDYVEVHGFSVFNLADACIVVGVLLVAIGLVFGKDTEWSGKAS